MDETYKSAPDKMADILNYGAINLALGIGYELGIFEIMDEVKEPLSSTALAEKSGLGERWLREWLPIMAAAGVVGLIHMEDNAGTCEEEHYILLRDWADILTKRSGRNNMGEYAREIPLLTMLVKNHVLEAFRDDKGISYDHYGPFRDFMSDLAENKHNDCLVADFLPSVDNGKIVQRLHDGIRVMDLGSGDGTAVLLMAKAYPKSRFTGIDVSKDMLDQAAERARKAGLDNIEFILCDASSPEMFDRFFGTFDYITAFDVIHDLAEPLGALKNIHSALARNGVFSMIDISASSNTMENLEHPMGAFLYTVSMMHCMPVGLHNNGAGLGMMWGREKAAALLKEAGFSRVDICDIPGDTFNDHYLCKDA